ncbi:MAG TPA: diphosphate--fructose-6-phosphate 1-phosphotransferase [Spirochaetia bacterium]|nr:diphosphate--fructose-6-phosphate 1-phosphotransferase [Spirochaetia bacterium]
MEYSSLQKERYLYSPKLPEILTRDIREIQAEFGGPTEAVADQKELKVLFPHTYGKPIVKFKPGKTANIGTRINIGVILSGGQAPGGHNVIAGLFDAIKKANPDSKLIGFKGGPSGILEDKQIEITKAFIDQYRNTGGFDIIGSGRTKLETEEQFATCAEVCKKHGIKAIVIIGGDDSNTNAAVLAEYFLKKGEEIQVIGVPKTIDGDLKNEYIEASFGFDTAAKTYAELIGNIERDANSAKKYWHFIRLMGRSASHICLECALQTQPNIAIISEEVEARKKTLTQIVDEIASVIAQRGNGGENFGVALIPEGLIEFIPEMGVLIGELNDLLAKNGAEFSRLASFEAQAEFIRSKLGKAQGSLFSSLPQNIQHQLLMDRDPHGNVQVSKIDTEVLLIDMIEKKLKGMKDAGTYRGKFSALHHFFGYEGRCAFPTNFDADYCYSLGYNAFLLIASGLSGYISSIRNLAAPASSWVAGGIPITMMMNLEQRHGAKKPVIKKALVDLKGKPFLTFASKRDEWAARTSYTVPGPIQYFGPDSVANQPTETLKLESERS